MMKQRTWMLILVLLAVPIISGGNCAFSFSSGGGSDDDDERKEGLTVVVNKGQFVDAPVEGLRYVSGAVSGITGSDGEFEYEEGSAVRFFIGDIPLGDAAPGQDLVTPLDLVSGGDLDTPAVINIARLLQSLDAVPGDDKITIPDDVRAAAVKSNESLATAIDFLQFSDDPAFNNAASQLVAVLTSEYPHTAMLVDGETARAHLARSLAAMGVR